MSKVTPFLWYQVPLGEVVAYYRSIFPDFREISTTPQSATFEIMGQRFHALNGGAHHEFSEAVSFVIDCEDQEEVGRVIQAMLRMQKIEVAELDRAAQEVPA